MSDLTPEAVSLLWPALQIIGAVLAAIVAIVGTVAAGFRWLEGRITATAKTLIDPLAGRLAVVERDVTAAHRRLDEYLGARE